MRHMFPRAVYFVVLLFALILFASSSFGQTPDASATPTPTPAASPVSDPTTASEDPTISDPAQQDRIDMVADTESADVPDFFRGLIDTEDYLRLRNSHIRRLRGLMDPLFQPWRRNHAIETTQQREQQMQVAASTGTSDPGFVGPTGPTAQAPTVPASLLGPWTALGPAPIPNGQTTTVSQAVSGRVTALAVHPTNENIVYVGTAQGGLYRSLNGGATWTALTDNALSLAIGSIAIDPLDPTTLVVGTGEGNLSADSFFGVGVYLIKNADTTPQLLGPFNKDGANNDVFTGRAITRVLVSPTDDNIVFVATTSGIGGIGADSIPSVLVANLPSRGLYRSTNFMSGTPTFTKITVQPANGGNRGITDIVFGATPNILLAGVNGFSTGGNDGGIWRTTNALDPTPTFTNQQVVGTATATIQIKLASNTVNGVTTVLAATGENPATTPAAPGNGSNCGAPGWVRRSTDGGVTFGLGLIQTSGFCNTQCFYDMAPAMDPTNSSIIYLGGSANADTNPPRNTCRSNVLTRSLDGTNFTRIDTGLHADTHAVAVAPSNPSVVYFGSDGGVWRSSNQGTSWSSINTAGFNATQFQSIAVHPIDRNFSIGGTQDNGTPFFHPDGTWTRADFGDGGFALIDQSATDTTNVTMYHTYFNQTNNLIGFGRVLTTANAHDNGWAFLGCQGAANNNGIICSNTTLFYAPMTLGPGTPNTFYFGTDRLYRSVNRGSTMTIVSQAPFQAGVAVSAIGISSQNDSVRIVGLRNGNLFATTTGANPLTNVRSASMPAKYVSRAVIDPNNSNTAYVAFSGFGIAGQQIWKTTNLNATPPTWTIAAAGLPDVPFNSFVIDPLNSNMLYAGSDIGVFVSSNGGTTWNPFGTGLPRVAVFDMAFQGPNRLVRIATHGRGAWEIPAAKAQALVTVLASNNSPTYGDNVTFTATVSPNGVLSNPSGVVTFSDGSLTLGTTSLTGSGPFTATFSTTLLSAGTHNIKASFGGDNIFDVSPSAPITITVTPAALSVTADNASRLYGAPNPPFTGSIVGIKNGDNITATYATAATQASPVGTYAIVPTLVDPDSKLGNYTVTSTNGVLTINPAPLTILANDATKILNAPNPSFTASYKGFVLGETPAVLSGVLSCTTTALTNSPVGSYPITCSGQSSTNYSITYLPGTLHIIFAPGGLVDGEPSHVVLSPVAADGSSVFKAGRTVPIKFRVGDVNGNSIGTPGVVTSFLIIGVITGTVSTPVDLPPSSTNGDTSFRFDPIAQQWIFNLNTSGLSAGSTYIFQIGLADGSNITFQFGLR
ncbi:MAG TPA: MBG domain-containing protein [Candidatus Angelobacter sp.]|nr:MBG domain-containing protein [Candidatus Angelobacter sp.]